MAKSLYDKQNRVRVRNVTIGLMLVGLLVISLIVYLKNRDISSRQSFEGKPFTLTEEQILSIEEQLDKKSLAEIRENPNPAVNKTVPFCAIKVFDSKENNNNKIEVYVFLHDIIFVEDNGSLKEDGGYADACLIKAERQGDKIIVNDVQPPEDGNAYMDSLQEMFSKDALKKLKDLDRSYGSKEMEKMKEHCYEKARKYYGIK